VSSSSSITFAVICSRSSAAVPSFNMMAHMASEKPLVED
jgi:hypothetical protein